MVLTRKVCNKAKHMDQNVGQLQGLVKTDIGQDHIIFQRLVRITKISSILTNAFKLVSNIQSSFLFLKWIVHVIGTLRMGDLLKLSPLSNFVLFSIWRPSIGLWGCLISFATLLFIVLLIGLIVWVVTRWLCWRRWNDPQALYVQFGPQLLFSHVSIISFIIIALLHF